MSNIVAILPARNESWVLGMSARALLMWCDSIVITDHCSTDETPHIISALKIEYGERVVSLEDSDPTWREMQQRQRLLDAARFLDATHVVTVDADEVVTGNLLPVIRQMVERTPRGQILQLPWLQLRGSINRVHTSGLWAEQSASVAFLDQPEWHWAARAGYDHHHRHPMGRPYVPHQPLGRRRDAGLLHLQMVSDKRLRYKQMAYKLSERLRWPNKDTPAQLNAKYDPTVNAVAQMGDAPAEWWAGYEHLMRYLHVDAEPWQAAECARLIRENPGIEKGLTDYGLLG